MKMHTDMQQYLEPTPTIDYDHPLVEEFARKHAVNPHEGREQAVRLYFAVRDGIRYDPYLLNLSVQGLKASTTLMVGRGWCVAKAIQQAASRIALATHQPRP
ncbi:MAG TPA: transglutaminase family protein, partial [Deltaproteobacteria bacterium]|nr:transglutaminase family protein [Deltaproteobacteria bacterium]